MTRNLSAPRRTMHRRAISRTINRTKGRQARSKDEAERLQRLVAEQRAVKLAVVVCRPRGAVPTGTWRSCSLCLLSYHELRHSQPRTSHTSRLRPNQDTLPCNSRPLTARHPRRPPPRPRRRHRHRATRHHRLRHQTFVALARCLAPLACTPATGLIAVSHSPNRPRSSDISERTQVSHSTTHPPCCPHSAAVR